MDGTTEPIIAIIGHPIAGNPTQFALESGFAAAKVDCRVLSIDLPPERVAAAITGMHAMNFRGVWIAPSCQSDVAKLLARPPADAPSSTPSADPLDKALAGCDVVESSDQQVPDQLDFLTLHAPPQLDQAWLPHSLKSQVWAKLASNALQDRDRGCAKLWWIDTQAQPSSTALLREKRTRLEQMQQTNYQPWADWTVDQIEIVDDPARIENVDSQHDQVIVFAPAQQPPRQWRMPDQSVTIDLNENWDASCFVHWDRIKSLTSGACIRGADVHAACLSKLTMLLFGLHVDTEIFQEALDEYLAV